MVKKPSASPSSLLGCGGFFTEAGYEELIVPAIWEQQTFIAKAGPQIVDEMYVFDDKAGRRCCLVPEITGLIQEQWRTSWSKTDRKPARYCYVARCYRYEEAQAEVKVAPYSAPVAVRPRQTRRSRSRASSSRPNITTASRD